MAASEPEQAGETGVSIQRLTFAAEDGGSLGAILTVPRAARALYVFGHGAGAGMEHPFMTASTLALAARGIASFRYNFPYMQRRSGRPDPTAVLLATVRRAIEAASAALPDLPLFAGGKSMGGRMTSQAQAEEPLPGVRGIVFYGFPLHRPKRLEVGRAEHLAKVTVPMLFLQGTRDEMADLELIRGVVAGLGSRAVLHVVEGADHGFHVLKRSGRTDAEVLDEITDRVATWIGHRLG